MLFSTIALESLLGPNPQKGSVSSVNTQPGLNANTRSLEGTSNPQVNNTYKTLIEGKKFDLIEDDNILKSLTAPLDNFKLSSGNVLRNIPKGTKAINLVGDKQLNTGADLAVPPGTPFKAMQEGEVVEAKDGYNDGYGNYVLLKHNIDGKEVFTRYAHLSNFGVKPGDIVKKGQIIGKTGNSGNTTKGSAKSGHLDAEVFIKGEKGKPLFIKTDNLYK